MNSVGKIAGVVALAIVAVGGGYWMGNREANLPGVNLVEAAEASAPVAEGATKKVRKLLYYRNPMGLADTSPTPKKDPMGMDYLPVYEGGDDEGSEPAS